MVLVSLRVFVLTVLVLEDFVAACAPSAARIIAIQNHGTAMPIRMGKVPAEYSVNGWHRAN